MTKRTHCDSGFCLNCGLRPGIHKVANDALKTIKERNDLIFNQEKKIQKLEGQVSQLKKEVKELQ